MSPPCNLISLPADVLLEILGHLLVDTPRLPHRASVVQTCQLLHELGIPLLYRVVDLISSDRLLKGPFDHCRTLFGVGGVLSLPRQEGSSVREIRVSAAQTSWDAELIERAEGFELGALDLPRCTSFSVDLNGQISGQWTFLPKLLPQITNLHDLHISYYVRLAYGPQPLFKTNSFYSALTNMIGSPAPSAPLETLTFSGAVWWDEVDRDTRQLSLCNRAFKVLAVDLRVSAVDGETDPDIDLEEDDAAYLDFTDIILDPLRSKLAKASDFLPEVRRIEFRVGSKLEEYLRTEAKKYERAGLSAIQQRILPLIVFIDDDGTERRLIEQTTVA